MKRLLLIAALLVSTSSFATVVQPVGAASQVLIPAAGSTAGANGTFFRSDISIINLTTHDQNVVLQWLPQAGSGGSNSSAIVTIPAFTGVRSSDFVSDFLHQTGLGSIIVTGATTGGGIDSTARLYVSSRIWSPQPGTSGTVSQSFPAIPLSTINTPAAALFTVSGESKRDAVRRAKETIWHPSQRVETLPDGRLRVTFGVGSILEIRHWVLGWGGDCEVVRPVELRRDIQAEIRAMSRTYDMDGATESARLALTKIPKPVEMIQDRRARREKTPVRERVSS